MGSTDWLHAQEHPGATTCFLLGKVDSHEELSFFAKYKDVAWFIEQEKLIPKHQFFPNLNPVTLESIDPENLPNIIQSILQQNPTALPDIYCSQSLLKENSAIYEFILQRIQVQTEETLRARQTRQEEGYIAQENILKNLPHYIRNRLDEHSAHALKNIPVAIIGAGPSLDASLHILEKCHSQLLIFCADSAHQSLGKINITPDATFSIDAEKPAQACIHARQKTGALFLSLKSPHDWIQRNDGAIHFLSGNNLTEDWLSDLGISKTDPKTLGNCGITAVNMAIHFGCSPILLFGMDHATDESGQGHANNVNQQISRGKTHNPANRTSTVPGNYSPRVKTFLLNEWEKLNDLIAGTPATQEIWNITDRGAKFESATLIHPNSFELSTEPLEQRPIIDFRLKQVHPVPIISVKNTIQNLIIQEKALIETILKAPLPQAPDLLQLFIRLFQHPDLSKLLGNLSLKTIPHLLNWANINQQNQENILKETQSLLIELEATATALNKL